MRFLNVFLFAVLFVLGSSNVMTRSEANETLRNLEAIGTTNDPKLLDKKAILSNKLAVFYQSIGNNEQAIVFLEQAIEYTRKRIDIEQVWNAQNLRDMQDLYLNLAKVQATSNYLDQAETSFQKAESYFKRLRPLLSDSLYNETATSIYTTAFSYCFHSKRFLLASKYGQTSLRYAKLSGNPRLISETNRLLGELKVKLGDRREAMKYFDIAIAAYDNSDTLNKLPQNLIQSKIGNLYFLKQYQEVIAFMNNEPMFASLTNLEDSIREISVSEYSGVLSNVFVLSYAHIRYFQQSGDAQYLKSAQQWQNLAYKLAEYAIIENGIDRLGQVLKSPEQKITSTLKNYELLEQENALSQKEIGQLLRTMDVYHSTQLHVNRLKNEINGENWNRQKFLRKDLKRLFEEIQSTDDQNPVIDSLRLRSKEITAELNTLATTTKRAEIAQEYQLGQREFLSRLKQYTLRNKKTVVTYYWSQRLSQLFIIGRNPERYFFRTVDVTPDFIQTVNTSYQLNSRFITDSDLLKKQDTLNQVLYDLLIAPVKKELTTTNLLVYPIGPMSYVSFDALRPDKDEYLVEKWNTSYTSSLFSMLRQRQESIVDTRKVFAFQPEKYGNDSLATLFHVKDEISTLDSCLTIEKYQGREATKQQFLSNSNDARILHVASHSILDAENPYESYLIFEEKDSVSNYQLKASEIFATSFNADLVVLSSCNSAKGTFSGDIGIVSLSNAFYFSGVPSTLGSLWSAQDRSSSQIISEFYRNLFQNKKKSQSLTESKRSYLAQADAIKKQPFFWANYVLYGDDSYVLIQQKDTQSYWIYWIILAGISILFLVYRFLSRSRALS